MASIHQRGDLWRVRYRDATGTNRSQGGFKTEREASLWASDIERRMRGGTATPDPRAERQSVAEAIEKWLDGVKVADKTKKEWERKARRHLLPAVGHLPIGGVDRGVVLEFRDVMYDADYAPSTVKQTIAVLRMALDDAYSRGGIDRANPASKPKVKTPKPRPVVPLTWPQVERLAAEVAAGRPSPRLDIARLASEGLSGSEIGAKLGLPPGTVYYHLKHLDEPVQGYRGDLGVMVRLAAGTGLRVGELRHLMPQGVLLDLAEVEVTAETAKTGKVRRVPIPRDLLEPVEALLHRRRLDQPLFCGANGGLLPWNLFYNRRFIPARERAGLPNVVFYDLRHTFASLLIAKNVHPRVVMEMMGHSTIKVTMDTYGHLYSGSRDEVREVLNDTISAGVAARLSRSSWKLRWRSPAWHPPEW